MVFKALAEADKAIAYFPGWSAPDSDDGYSHFQAPLSVRGITEAGLFLEGGTYPSIPDRNVTFELVLLVMGGARRVKLIRLDWRSLRDGHTNQKRYHCPDCPRRTTDTHLHSFDINWEDPPGRFRGPKLPCARDIPEPLQSFEELRTYVGKHFKINNIDVVSVPDWVYKLDL